MTQLWVAEGARMVVIGQEDREGSVDDAEPTVVSCN